MQFTKYFVWKAAFYVVSLVDKCAPVRYNVSILRRRYKVMKAYCSTAKFSNRNSSAAVACTSAHNGLILDTVILAVSILLALIIHVLPT